MSAKSARNLQSCRRHTRFQLNPRTNHHHSASKMGTCLLWSAVRPELAHGSTEGPQWDSPTPVFGCPCSWTRNEAGVPAFQIWSSMPYLVKLTADQWNRGRESQQPVAASISGHPSRVIYLKSSWEKRLNTIIREYLFSLFQVCQNAPKFRYARTGSKQNFKILRHAIDPHGNFHMLLVLFRLVQNWGKISKKYVKCMMSLIAQYSQTPSAIEKNVR